MFKRLFAALRRKRGGNVASPKDAGNVSVPEEELAQFRTDEVEKEQKEPVKKQIATEPETILSASESIRKETSEIIHPDMRRIQVADEESFEKMYKYYTHCLSYKSQKLSKEDSVFKIYSCKSILKNSMTVFGPNTNKEFQDDAQKKLNMMNEVHDQFDCLLDFFLWGQIKIYGDDFSSEESGYINKIIKFKNNKEFNNAMNEAFICAAACTTCSTSMAYEIYKILFTSGDITDAYMWSKILSNPIKIKSRYGESSFPSSSFFPVYARLVLSIENIGGLTFRDCASFVNGYVPDKDFYFANSTAPVANVPLNQGVFYDDVKMLKGKRNKIIECLQLSGLTDSDFCKCKQSAETVFEDLPTRIGRTCMEK